MGEVREEEERDDSSLRRRATDRPQPRAVQFQPVADVVQANGVGQLPIDVRRRVTPRRELPRINLVFPFPPTGWYCNETTSS